MGLEQMELEVNADNYQAIHLYESLGFEIRGTFPNNMKYKDGTYADAHWMVKNLKTQSWKIDGVIYSEVKLLGKGKGGYSYLVTDGNKEFVLKQIHHEPCDYYAFGDKLEAELSDYEQLKKIGIAIPTLIAVDKKGYHNTMVHYLQLIGQIRRQLVHGQTLGSISKKLQKVADAV